LWWYREKSVRQLQAEVTELHARHEEKEGQWRLEQADMYALRKSLYIVPKALALELMSHSHISDFHIKLTLACHSDGVDRGENLGRLEGEKAEVLRKNGQLRTALADAEAAHA
jgi:hypothetical protein